MRRTIVLLAIIALTVLVASGVALAVTKIGGPGPDHLKGTNGADNLIGQGGNDTLLALAGNDDLIGGPGKDVVVGGKGSDNVLGSEGNDLVSDGPNREFSTDKLSAGGGTDVVGVFNDPAFKDIVTCAGGFDRVFADKKDLVAPDCEKVADTPSELAQLANSIPESFFEGLPPGF